MTNPIGSVPALIAVLLTAATVQAPDIRYVVRPVVRDALVELDITVSFTGEASGRTAVRMPSDRFGAANMHRFIREIEVSTDAVTRQVAGDSVMLIEHAPGADLTVRYVLRYDSAAAGFVAYGPSVSDKHFHFLGSQWMVRLGSPDNIRRVEVRTERGGLAGPFAGSFGLDPGSHTLEASQNELDWSVIAGGGYREHRFACEGRPVVTLVQGAFAVPDDSIFSMAERIACGQRRIFNDYTQPFYAIVLTARERLRAGASFLNAFACFARPASDASQLAALLAHEMTHAWLPRKLRLVPGPGEVVPTADFSWFHDIRYDWFHEGFTEYLSRLLQVRTGLASDDWFVQRLNEDFAQLAVHPYATTSAYELEQAAIAGRYTNLHQRLSYLRGALLAFRWDATIRRASGDTLDIMEAVRRLLAAAASTNGRLPRPAFEHALTQLGVSAAYDVEHVALGGEPIRVDALAPGPDWMLTFDTIPAFEPGFDVVASINADTIMGVREPGAAWAAGLRNGMPIVRHSNAQRWNASWRADLPMTIVVRQDGRERTVEFHAVRGGLAVPHFVRRD